MRGRKWEERRMVEQVGRRKGGDGMSHSVH